jgi:hypothetical protein
VKKQKQRMGEKKQYPVSEIDNSQHNNKPNNTHNSLQHDSSVAVPLLEILVEAIKKEKRKKERTKQDVEEEVEEESLTTKDDVIVLAEHIRESYAGELQQQAYAPSRNNYDASGAYENAAMQGSNSNLPYSETEIHDTNSTKARDTGARRLKDENSAAYRLSQGSKYQAFIMTDPKGRIHSAWNIIRIINENQEGLLEQNNGLHYQGLS